MYTPTLFKEDDLQKIADLVWAYPLGLVISSKMDASKETVCTDVPAKGPVPVASPLPFFFIHDGAQLKGILSLEVIITDIQGKWKMSQKKNAKDFERVKHGLSDPSHPHQNAKLAEKR